MKNKIGWCNTTWNPVWGCRNNCEYCYARVIAKRFRREMAENECHYCWRNHIGTNPYTKRAFINCTEKIKNFIPIFLYSQFNKKLPKKPQRIFVGSMSEIAHWEAKWVNEVIFKIFEYPQHIFQILTRYPEIYCKWDFPENCWLGVTITKKEDFMKNDDNWEYFFNEGKEIHFFSFEPLLEPVDIDYLNCSNIDWVIIGAETGNRKGKVIPKWEWINDIVLYYKDKYIPIYLKDSLKEIYPIEIKEFPYLKGVRTNV